MKIINNLTLVVALMILCSVVFGAVLGQNGGNGDQGDQKPADNQPKSFLEQLRQQPFNARIAAKKKISKDITAEYESILAWLKTRNPRFTLDGSDPEVLAVQLLSEVRWSGAIDFFIEKILWHTRVYEGGTEKRMRTRFFPCVEALMKFRGHELKIAKAALTAKSDIEMQLLCVVLILTTNWGDPEKILVFSAGDEKASQPRLEKAKVFIKNFDKFKWDPRDCEDFDEYFMPYEELRNADNDSPPALTAGGESAPSGENDSTPPSSGDTPAVIDSSAPRATDTSRPSGTPNATGTGTSSESGAEAAVAEAAPFPWAIVIVVAIAALSLGAITTLLLTRRKKA